MRIHEIINIYNIQNGAYYTVSSEYPFKLQSRKDSKINYIGRYNIKCKTKLEAVLLRFKYFEESNIATPSKLRRIIKLVSEFHPEELI